MSRKVSEISSRSVYKHMLGIWNISKKYVMDSYVKQFFLLATSKTELQNLTLTSRQISFPKAVMIGQNVWLSKIWTFAWERTADVWWNVL